MINYRIFDKDKHDHVQDMLKEMVEVKQLPFTTVLMDSWYATTQGMKYLDEQEKIYYCPIKSNRLIKVEGGYQRVENLS